ncbi:hypothetical protein BDZ89DRAFT_610607 [Hymenopellis radicata]|nr:hypothetical protein BDZ89DRAFT_610607 [Hymenopellis radicata]
MPSFARTLPIVLLVGASTFAAPVLPRASDVYGLSNMADQNPAEALSAVKLACSNNMHSDECDSEVVPRYNILELALSKRLSVSRATDAADVEPPTAPADDQGVGEPPAAVADDAPALPVEKKRTDVEPPTAPADDQAFGEPPAAAADDAVSVSVEKKRTDAEPPTAPADDQGAGEPPAAFADDAVSA